MHPINCRCVVCLVDRSSFGTPEAKALRDSVPDEKVARVLARAKELDAEAQATPPLVDELRRASEERSQRKEGSHRAMPTLRKSHDEEHQGGDA